MIKLFKVMLLSLLFCTAAFAEEEIRKFDNPDQRALYMQLADELRCPKCQNQNIADSDASVAKDLRNKVHKLVMEGQNKEQVVNFMVERYGYFVYYKPPVTAATLILWLLPIMFVLFTMVLIWFKSKRSQLTVDKSQWTDAQEQELNKLIGDIEQAQIEPAQPLTHKVGST
jgi:cytochrome c-type biogenesis protein CcmH